jgi:hypothetical protein
MLQCTLTSVRCLTASLSNLLQEVARLFGAQIKNKLGWRIDLKNYNTEVMVRRPSALVRECLARACASSCCCCECV